MSELEPPTAATRTTSRMLLYRQPAPLELDFPADVSELARTPYCAAQLADAGRRRAEQVQDVLIATGEAVANAIEHGHRDHPGAPSACARPPRRPGAGQRRRHRRLEDAAARTSTSPAVAVSRSCEALMQDVTIHSNDAGTTVHMFSRIT